MSNEELEEGLRNIGLSKNESKVYLALLELGVSNAGAISKLSKIHRTNVYDSLSSLSEKGLVSLIMKNNVKFYEAIGPEGLVNLIKEKEMKLKEIIPKLKDNHTVKDEITKTYKGVNAFKTILLNWLDKGETIFTYGIPKEASKYIGTFLVHWHKKRRKMKIKIKHLYNEDAKSRIKFLNRLSLTEARYLPKEFNTDSNTSICGDEVMIIHWKKVPFIIHLKNRELAKTYRKYFELLYSKSKVD